MPGSGIETMSADPVWLVSAFVVVVPWVLVAIRKRRRTTSMPERMAAELQAEIIRRSPI